MNFIRLLRDEWSLYETDIETFRNRSEAQAYFRWFRDVRSFRYEPSLLHDAKRLESAFVKRMGQTAALWTSISQNGYNQSAPVRLASGHTLETVNGKLVNGQIFSGDGCHRVACLQLLGRKSLDPTDYEVALYPRLQPLDITAVLIELGVLDKNTYQEFIRDFYGKDFAGQTIADIERHLAAKNPTLRAELHSVLKFDLAKFNHREGLKHE